MKPQPIAPEIQQILRSQEMRGERLVNKIRFGFYLMSLGMMAGVWQINTADANKLFMVQMCSVLAYSVLLGIWFRTRGDEYAPWVKYVSIVVDISALHLSAVAMSVNHAGIIEYFQSYVSLVLVLWNLLSALRYSVAACIFSGVVSLCLSSLILYYTVSNQLVEISPVTVYGQPAINLGDEVLRLVFIAMPAFIAAVIARISRNLILRAEEESLGRVQVEQQREQLSRYVSKNVADFIFKEPGSMALGGARKNATVFFSDIRNFTPLSEDSEPEEVVALLNEYFTEMVALVFKYGGTLDKFLGDGLMALFGVPFEIPDAEIRATLCAMEMIQRSSSFNERYKLAERGLPPLHIGVGIASGPVVAGNIGSEERMDYTVIGDTVNFAARLEGLNRSLGTTIIISEATQAALAGRLPLRPLPPLKVKGKKGTPPLFAVLTDKVSPEDMDRLSAEVLSRAPLVTPDGAPAGR